MQLLWLDPPGTARFVTRDALSEPFDKLSGKITRDLLRRVGVQHSILFTNCPAARRCRPQSAGAAVLGIVGPNSAHPK